MKFNSETTCVFQTFKIEKLHIEGQNIFCFALCVCVTPSPPFGCLFSCSEVCPSTLPLEAHLTFNDLVA